MAMATAGVVVVGSKLLKYDKGHMTSVEECQRRAPSGYALEHIVALALAAQRLLAPVLFAETWRVPLVQFRASRVRSLHHA